MASQAIVSDQQTVAWLARHKVGLLSVIAGVVLGEVWMVHITGLYLPFSGMVMFALLAYGVRWIAGLAWWWNRRRILLAKHSLPAPGPVEMWKERRAERKRIAYLNKQWAAYCQANNLTGLNKVIPRLHNIKGTVSGDITALIAPGPLGVKGGPGMTAIERITSLHADIAYTCGAKNLLVRPTKVGYAVLTFLWSEQFERVIPISELPVRNVKSGHVPFAVNRSGEAVTIELPQSTLIAGMKGGGKSGITWSFLTGLIALNIKTDLYASDPKNGIELNDLNDEVMERMPDRVLRVAAYTSTVDGTVKLIEQFNDAMRARGEQTKNRQWTVKDADQFPLNLLVFDECVQVFSALLKSPANSPARKAYETLKTIESQGRAIGFMVLYLTQLAQKNILEDIRDMVPQQISLKQKNRVNTEMVLGERAEDLGAPCSRINNTPGFGFMQSDTERGFTPFRATYCDDDDIKRIAKSQLPEGFGTGLPKGEVNRSTAVYRFHNHIGELLYVGKTVDVAARFAQHAADKPWWHEVDMSKTLVTWHPSEPAALRVEEHEIKSRLPRYNKQHNGANPLARTYVKPEPAEPAQPLSQRALRLVKPERREPQPWEFRPVRVTSKRRRKPAPAKPAPSAYTTPGPVRMAETGYPTEPLKETA